jgi:hypothetical protein
MRCSGLRSASEAGQQAPERAIPVAAAERHPVAMQGGTLVLRRHCRRPAGAAGGGKRGCVPGARQRPAGTYMTTVNASDSAAQRSAAQRSASTPVQAQQRRSRAGAGAGQHLGGTGSGSTLLLLASGRRLPNVRGPCSCRPPPCQRATLTAGRGQVDWTVGAARLAEPCVAGRGPAGC